MLKIKLSEIRRIIKEEAQRLMTDKEWDVAVDNIKLGIDNMNKSIDKAIKNKDQKTLDYWISQIDKMKKILNK